MLLPAWPASYPVNRPIAGAHRPPNRLSLRGRLRQADRTLSTVFGVRTIVVGSNLAVGKADSPVGDSHPAASPHACQTRLVALSALVRRHWKVALLHGMAIVLPRAFTLPWFPADPALGPLQLLDISG
jgi:hypothetical protein